MERFLIISNRLPVQISISEENIEVTPSVGGLATGMKSVSKSSNSQWIGWSGVDTEKLSAEQAQEVQKALGREDCINVDLTEEEVELYYEGFSNKTVWPLFHYFTQFVKYEEEHWEAYKKVNQKFADVIAANIEGVQKIWIHDYHLLLLPQMIKERFPQCYHWIFPAHSLSFLRVISDTSVADGDYQRHVGRRPAGISHFRLRKALYELGAPVIGL